MHAYCSFGSNVTLLLMLLFAAVFSRWEIGLLVHAVLIQALICVRRARVHVSGLWEAVMGGMQVVWRESQRDFTDHRGRREQRRVETGHAGRYIWLRGAKLRLRLGDARYSEEGNEVC